MGVGPGGVLRPGVGGLRGAVAPVRIDEDGGFRGEDVGDVDVKADVGRVGTEVGGDLLEGGGGGEGGEGRKAEEEERGPGSGGFHFDLGCRLGSLDGKEERGLVIGG